MTCPPPPLILSILFDTTFVKNFYKQKYDAQVWIGVFVFHTRAVICWKHFQSVNKINNMIWERWVVVGFHLAGMFLVPLHSKPPTSSPNYPWTANPLCTPTTHVHTSMIHIYHISTHPHIHSACEHENNKANLHNIRATLNALVLHNLSASHLIK